MKDDLWMQYDYIGEMHTVEAPQYGADKGAVVVMDGDDPDTVISYAEQTNCTYSEDAQHDTLILIMPGRRHIGPELYTREALRRSLSKESAA